MRRSRRGWVVAATGVGVLVVGAATLVLATGVGTPEDDYATAPDACQLLDDRTVRELVGGAWDADAEQGGGERRLLERAAEVRMCDLDGRDPGAGSILASAYRFSGSRFGLGPASAEQAEEIFANGQAVSLGEGGACSYQLRTAGAEACGVRDNAGFDLHVRCRNVYVSLHVIVSRSGEPSEPRLEALIAEATSQIVSRLESAPIAGTGS